MEEVRLFIFIAFAIPRGLPEFLPSMAGWNPTLEES